MPVLSVGRGIGPHGIDLGLPFSKAAAATAEPCVIGHPQFLPKQPEHARGEAFHLAQGDLQGELQHQLDRHVRVPDLATGRDPPRRLLPVQGSRIGPELQVATPRQAGFIGWPVMDPVSALRMWWRRAALCLNNMPKRVTAQPQPGHQPPNPSGSLRRCS